ncbi:MAG: YhcH/YjgK/YiaL family protein [Daejeonella sp.]|uniref:YhcH/YjgK/YiaL family protein n=1 Tax=Daejeonella sp. TaxID=2805397 RepID=UPI003C77681A
MIIDTLDNAAKYYSVHPLFQKAFEYISTQDLKSLEAGKFDISEGLKGVIAEKEGMTAVDSAAKFECHNQNIDIQLCITGPEVIGWRPRSKCVSPKAEYNTEKDVLFFDDAPDMHFTLKDNQFAIFFPEDVHAPMIASGVVKKMIIKVRK